MFRGRVERETRRGGSGEGRERETGRCGAKHPCDALIVNFREFQATEGN